MFSCTFNVGCPIYDQPARQRYCAYFPETSASPQVTLYYYCKVSNHPSFYFKQMSRVWESKIVPKMLMKLMNDLGVLYYILQSTRPLLLWEQWADMRMMTQNLVNVIGWWQVFTGLTRKYGHKKMCPIFNWNWKAVKKMRWKKHFDLHLKMYIYILLPSIFSKIFLRL